MAICELTHIIAKPVNVQVNVWTCFAQGLIRLARFAQRESLGPIPLARFLWLYYKLLLWMLLLESL